MTNDLSTITIVADENGMVPAHLAQLISSARTPNEAAGYVATHNEHMLLRKLVDLQLVQNLAGTGCEPCCTCKNDVPIPPKVLADVFATVGIDATEDIDGLEIIFAKDACTCGPEADPDADKKSILFKLKVIGERLEMAYKQEGNSNVACALADVVCLVREVEQIR